MSRWVWLYLQCLVVVGLSCGQVYGQSSTGQSSFSGPDTDSGCSEPSNMMELYRDLRQQQIDASSVLEEPSVSSASSSTKTTTRLGSHHHSGHGSTNFTGVCHCRERDELNHDPNRIPRILPQTRCQGRRPWRTAQSTAECEEIYRPMRVKRRVSCSNGVYQYSDTWESIPVGCKCQVYPRVVVARD